MKTSKLLISALAISSLLFLVSCVDHNDEPTQREFLQIGETTLEAASSANVYLVKDDAFDSYLYRNYIISDGVLVSGNGYSLENYEGATFLLAMELSQISDASFLPGSFPTWSVWQTPAAEQLDFGNIYFLGNVLDQVNNFGTSDSYGNHEPVILTGGVEPGETITVKFSGQVTNGDDNGQICKFLIKGTVIDKRVE